MGESAPLSEKRPGGHDVQLGCPAMAKRPARHARHLLPLLPLRSQNCPAGQRVQLSAPAAGWNLPRGQSLQLDGSKFFMPSLVENWPDMQSSVHRVAPGLAEYLPPGHTWHATSLAPPSM